MNASFAERLLQGYGIREPEQIDLEAIAYDQGAIVKYRPLSSCEARIVGKGHNAIISINSSSLPERQRFSLGHELGHWIQDKGTISMICARGDIGPHRTGSANAESEANAFASQLLMPSYLFRPLSAGLPLTFASAEALQSRFRASLTATAIKLVKTGHFPGMILCHKDGILQWHVPGPDLPRSLQPFKELDEDSQAYDLWKRVINASRPQQQSADTWIDREGAEDYTVVEDCLQVAQGVIVTLLWWKDEGQIRDLSDAES